MYNIVDITMIALTFIIIGIIVNNELKDISIDIKEVDQIDIKEVKYEIDIKEIDEVDIKEIEEIDIKEVSPLSSSFSLEKYNDFDPLHYVSLFGNENIRDMLSSFTVGEVIELFY